MNRNKWEHVCWLDFVVLVFLVAARPATAQNGAGVRTLAFSLDSKLLAAGTGEPKQTGSVTLFDVATRAPRWTHAETGGVGGVAFSPDGQTIVVAAYANTARFLDVATDKVKAVFQHPNQVRAVAYSPNGKLLATACSDKLVRVWDIGAAAVRTTCEGHRDRILSIDFSADGKHLLSAAGDDGAKLWNAANGTIMHSWMHGEFLVRFARFTPDGKIAITAGYDGTTRLWDVASGELKTLFNGTGGVQFAFSPDAKMLATCGRHWDIGLFDLTLTAPTAGERKRIHGILARLDDDSYDAREVAGKELRQIGFLAEAELRQAAKDSKSAEVRMRARRLREQMLSRPRAILHGSSADVASVAFSHDGKTLASGRADGVIVLWDLASQKEIAHLLPGR